MAISNGTSRLSAILGICRILQHGHEKYGQTRSIYSRANSKYRDGSDPDNYPNVNHLKWLLESGSGFQHQHNIGIQGGNTSMSYNLSIGYRNQEGMTANTNNERFTALFSMKSNLSKSLHLNLNINAYNNTYNAPNGEPQSIDGMIGYTVREGAIYAGKSQMAVLVIKITIVQKHGLMVNLS